MAGLLSRLKTSLRFPRFKVGMSNNGTATPFNALQTSPAGIVQDPTPKVPKSFEVLGKLNPDVLEQHLPSFRRARVIHSTINSEVREQCRTSTNDIKRMEVL